MTFAKCDSLASPRSRQGFPWLHRCAWLAAILSHSLVCRGSPIETDSPSATQKDQVAAAPAATQPEVPPSVEQRYAAALELYRAGDLLGALQIQKECFEATQSPNLLFNIAQLYRELKDCVQAMAFYQRYLEADTDGVRRIDAERYLSELRPQCKPADAATPEMVPLTPILTSVTTHGEVQFGAPATNILGWFALGVSAIAAGATVYAAVETHRAKYDVEHPRRDSNAMIDGDFLAHRQDDFYSGRAWAYGLGGLTALSAGLGIYAIAWSGRGQRHPMSATPSASSISISGVTTLRSTLISGSWSF